MGITLRVKINSVGAMVFELRVRTDKPTNRPKCTTLTLLCMSEGNETLTKWPVYLQP